MDITIECEQISHVERAWEDTNTLFVSLREIDENKLIKDLCEYYGDKDYFMGHINRMRI